jgi:hypothetical protein
LHLQDKARAVFVDTALNPRAPNEAARAAAERYKKQTGFSRPRTENNFRLILSHLEKNVTERLFRVA